MPLPAIALSVRQPWAWAICHAGKHLENRTWGGWGANKQRQRGPVCIHASSGMTRAEYEHARDFMAKHGVTCPDPASLVRGGIIGTAVIIDWTTRSHSFWFMRPGALVLKDMTPLAEPIPCSGALGFFTWKAGGELAAPAKWMLPRITNTPEHFSQTCSERVTDARRSATFTAADLDRAMKVARAHGMTVEVARDGTMRLVPVPERGADLTPPPPLETRVVESF